MSTSLPQNISSIFSLERHRARRLAAARLGGLSSLGVSPSLGGWSWSATQRMTVEGMRAASFLAFSAVADLLESALICARRSAACRRRVSTER